MNIKRNLLGLSLLLSVLGAASVAPASTHRGWGNAGQAYGYANEGNAYGSTNHEFINRNFVPRGTSPAQVPSHHEEDNYGPEAGKD